MLDQWERWVQFHELYLKTEPEDAPKIQLSSLVPSWIERIKKREAVKLIKNDTAAIRIADVQNHKDKNALVLLLQYSDTNVTDPAFIHLNRGSLRVEPKLDGEGVAVSSHVVLSTTPYDNEELLYGFLLEEVPGLGRSNVSPFIRSELKAISKGMFEYVDKDDNNKKKNYRPASEIVGEPSKKFIDELEGGSILQSIELIKLTESKPEIDEEGFYHETSRHVRLVPDKDAFQDIKSAISKVFKLAKEDGYHDIKFRYKLPQGKQKTATMGSTLSDIQDALIVKNEVVKADESLGQCSDKIVPSIAKNMIKLLHS